MATHERIETALSAALDRATKKPSPSRLSDALRHAVLDGGARVRPQLCLAVAHACGDRDESNLVSATAAALELIHCASLVHDDLPCFDDADLRREKIITSACAMKPQRSRRWKCPSRIDKENSDHRDLWQGRDRQVLHARESEPHDGRARQACAVDRLRSKV